MVTGRDYRQLIDALSAQEARMSDNDAKPDAIVAAMLAIVMRRAAHFREIGIIDILREGLRSRREYELKARVQ